MVDLNNAGETIEEINNMPVKTANGGTVYLRDVAHVRDGSNVQNNIVHVDGSRAVLSTVLKNGRASTIDVVDGIKNILPVLRQQMPPELKVNVLTDQSLFVKAAINGVVREGAVAAGLTSLMILFFLGSWRSTAIIATSIPLAVLSALMGLWATGQTLNIMTLGGLALAVGILVDDATVTIENINWHLEQGKPVYDAIMDGARQITQPAFVSLLCICVAFVPMFSLQGVAGFLFVPMAMAVVFAMIASFILSRTLVPTLALYLLKLHAEEHAALGNNMFARLQKRFEKGFADTREGYRNLLALAMGHRRRFVFGFLGAVAVSMLLVPFLGEDFFPVRGFRPDHASCPHARRHAGGRHDPDRRPDRTRGSPHHSQGPAYDHRGHDRVKSEPHQFDLFNHRHRRPAGLGHLHHPQRQSQPHGGLCPHDAGAFAPAVSVGYLLLPAAGHHQPDPEFRQSGAAGCSGQRHQDARRPRPLRCAFCARSATFRAWWMRGCSSRAISPS